VTRLVRLVLATAPGLLVASACPSLDPFACQGDDQCTLAADGVCHEDHGACSYPDETCPSGHRWSQTASGLAGTCVDADATTGGSASSSSTPESSTGPVPLAECGNGVIEGDEECDDPDVLGCTACTPECRLAGQLRWTTVYDGSGFADFFDSVVVDASGDVIVVGRTSVGPLDADKNRVVARYDSAGEPLWAMTEDRIGIDDLNCVVLSPSGEVLVAGVRQSDMDTDELWVGRYDDGLIEDLLAYSALEPLPTQAQGCTFTTDERLVVVGMIEGTGTGDERWDRLVLYDALGDDPHALTIEGGPVMAGARDKAFEVAAAPDGGFVVGGNVTPLASTKASERWIGRFDATGTHVVEYVDGGPGYGHEEVLGVAFHDGKILAAGTTVINEGNTEQTWIARFGYEDLSLEWEVDLGLPPAALVTGMTLDADGTPLVVVVVQGDESTLEDDATALAALDAATGECLWLVENPGGLGRTGGLAMAPDGSVVVVGADAPTDQPATNALVASLWP